MKAWQEKCRNAGHECGCDSVCMFAPTDPQLMIKQLNDTIDNLRELLINAEERGEMKAIVQFINQFPKSMTETDRQIKNKRLVYEFAKWLQGENFTNPDVSIHDWVEKFFATFKV